MLELAQLERRAPHPLNPREPIPHTEDIGPRRPKVDQPDTSDLLRRMRRTDPNQARRYRQRTGQ